MRSARKKFYGTKSLPHPSERTKTMKRSKPVRDPTSTVVSGRLSLLSIYNSVNRCPRAIVLEQKTWHSTSPCVFSPPFCAIVAVKYFPRQRVSSTERDPLHCYPGLSREKEREVKEAETGVPFCWFTLNKPWKEPFSMSLTTRQSHSNFDKEWFVVLSDALLDSLFVSRPKILHEINWRK